MLYLEMRGSLGTHARQDKDIKAAPVVDTSSCSASESDIHPGGRSISCGPPRVISHQCADHLLHASSTATNTLYWKGGVDSGGRAGLSVAPPWPESASHLGGVITTSARPGARVRLTHKPPPPPPPPPPPQTACIRAPRPISAVQAAGGGGGAGSDGSDGGGG